MPTEHRLTAWTRTFRATFGASLRNQLRFYTLRGWMLSTLLGSLMLLASAAVIAHFVVGGGVPPRFFALTGYPAYLPFAVLGLAANGLVLSALDDGGTAVYQEESEGTWDLIALTPMNRFVWMFAKTSAGMTASFVDFALLLGAGTVAFGLTFTAANLAVAVIGLVFTVVALQGLGFLFAAAGLYWKQPYALSMIFGPVFVFLSGMLFPVQALPGWVQAVSNVFPITHGLTILRDSILLGKGLGELLPAFEALAASGAMLMVLGYAAFQVMERKARARGVMGRY